MQQENYKEQSLDNAPSNTHCSGGKKRINITFPEGQEFYELGLETVQSSDEVFDFYNQVPGFLTGNEGVALLLSARNGPGAGEIVEIGSFLGKSTIWLASGSSNLGREKVTAIDPHVGSAEHQVGKRFEHMMPESGSTYDQFLNNIDQYNLTPHVTPLRCSSHEARSTWSDPIRLLFIDGDHSYEAVKDDFLGWSKFVIPGGIIALHDVGQAFEGPKRVVKEYIDDSAAYRPICHINSLYIAQKN